MEDFMNYRIQIEQARRPHTIGIFNDGRDHHRLAADGNYRLMPEAAKGRARVGRKGTVPRPWRSGGFRPLDQGGSRAPVEIEPGVNLVRARQPPGAKADLVDPSVGDARAACERRLHVVVHMLGGPGGEEMQDPVGRICRIFHHLAVAVIAQQPPARGA